MRQLESKFLNDWLMTKHPNAAPWKRVRLGPLPDVSMARMFKVTQRWADAIFIEDDIVYIIEAKLKPDAGAISQLGLYSDLFGRTPEFKNYSTLPRRLVFLTTRRDADIEMLATRSGIIYEVYKPKWL